MTRKYKKGQLCWVFVGPEDGDVTTDDFELRQAIVSSHSGDNGYLLADLHDEDQMYMVFDDEIFLNRHDAIDYLERRVYEERSMRP